MGVERLDPLVALLEHQNGAVEADIQRDRCVDQALPRSLVGGHLRQRRAGRGRARAFGRVSDSNLWVVLDMPTT